MKALLATSLFCLFLTVALLASPGCGKTRKPPANAGVARETLRTALDAWKKGEPVESLQGRTPPILVADHEWKAGFELLNYKVSEKDQLFGSDLRCQVKLSLRNPKGKTLDKQATYSVGTNNALSKVAPIQKDERTGEPNRTYTFKRASLESRPQVEKVLEQCRQRTPRLPLLDEAKARELFPADWPVGPLSQWVRLLANIPKDGLNRLLSLRSAEQKSDLKPMLRAQVSWIVARQDRAWYAVGDATRRLREQGWSDDQLFTLDGDWHEFTPAERALFTLARKLAASPIVLTDDDVAKASKLTGPRKVVQLIHYTTLRAFFDRITEASGLQLEDGR
jgi:hypothetical protein